MTALLLAEFADSKRFADATRRAHAAHYHLLDAFSPFPVEGVSDLLEHRRSHIRVVMFIAGMAMAVLAYGLEFYSAVIDFPYNSGGRPLNAWPTFMLVPFATGILVAATAGFIAFLCECGLPRLYDPLFAVTGFERVSQDRFVLAIARPPIGEDLERAIVFFRGAGATAVHEADA